MPVFMKLSNCSEHLLAKFYPTQYKNAENMGENFMYTRK